MERSPCGLPTFRGDGCAARRGSRRSRTPCPTAWMACGDRAGRQRPALRLTRRERPPRGVPRLGRGGAGRSGTGGAVRTGDGGGRPHRDPPAHLQDPRRRAPSWTRSSRRHFWVLLLSRSRGASCTGRSSATCADAQTAGQPRAGWRPTPRWQSSRSCTWITTDRDFSLLPRTPLASSARARRDRAR